MRAAPFLSPTHRSTRPAIVALLAAGLLTVFAAPAFAHASHVSHQETCPEGVTQTVVTFDNDHGLAAVVTFQWAAGSQASVDLAGKTGAHNPTVSLPSHDVGTLSYHVKWSDNFRQPTTGESSLTIGPLEHCTPVTTTTTTEAPTTTTTTVEAPTTTTTMPASTTTTAPAPLIGVTTTTIGTEVLGETLTRPAAPAPAATLPTTGSPIGVPLLLAAIALTLGALATHFGRPRSTPQS